MQMRGEGMSRGYFGSRNCLGKKTMKSCKLKGNLDNVVFIDLDSDVFDDVIMIDVPESLRQKLRGSNVFKGGKRIQFQGIISIDDDDDGDDDGNETNNVDQGGTNAEGADGGNLGNNGPASDLKQEAVDVDIDDCRVIPENQSVIKLSKCKKTFNKNAPARNCFGLDSDSENDSSQSGCSDCEVVEGSLDEIRRRWEKASAKKNSNVCKGQSGLEDHISSFCSHDDTYPKAAAENRTKQSLEVPMFYTSKNAKFDLNKSVNDQCFDDSVLENGSAPSEARPSKESFASKNPSSVTPGVRQQEDVHQDNMKMDSLGMHFCVTKCQDTPNQPGTSILRRGNKSLIDSRANLQLHNERDPLYVSPSDVASVQRDIINEREKLKETDEYKRVVEEEWAARQRQLQIQAEEAQRLKKRKKAESLRILDMEKRQRQRVEEVRETQKKDEENLKMKEGIRVEVRKKLFELEVTCTDMASLLRGLGIQVGSGFQPLPHEVNAAYRRALLKFHPDRATRTDIHQQVESEEKFKLISRMKQKFLSTLCY